MEFSLLAIFIYPSSLELILTLSHDTCWGMGVGRIGGKKWSYIVRLIRIWYSFQHLDLCTLLLIPLACASHQG